LIWRNGAVILKKEQSFWLVLWFFIGGKQMYDIAIIGAGVIGSMIGRILSKYDLKICILEKHIDAAMGASGANSGIIHAGYDAKPNTLKEKFNISGSNMMEKVCEDLNVAYDKCGSLVIAFNEQENEVLNKLLVNGKNSGVKNLKLIEKEEIFKLEPNINKKVIKALIAPSAAIISPYKLNINALKNAVINGVEFLRENEVINIEKENNIFIIKTSKQQLKSKIVINCSGIYADKISKMVGDESFKIIPRSGEYVLFDKTEGKLFNKVIFQTPTDEGKGVLVTKTVDGNLLIGPDAKEIFDRDIIQTHKSSVDYVYKKSLKTSDKILLNKSITTFAGVRATPNTKDFIIEESKICSQFINVAGIESPGLSSAPAISEYVEEIVKNIIGSIKIKKEYTMKLKSKKYFSEMTNEEKEKAIKENKLYGKIVCRCENVTEGEIIESINKEYGAITVDGIKKRTRAGMGRCQGGFCLPSIIDILADQLNVNKKAVTKGDTGSYILSRRTRI